MCNFPGDLWLLLLVLLRLVDGSDALDRRQLGSGVAICWDDGRIARFLWGDARKNHNNDFA